MTYDEFRGSFKVKKFFGLSEQQYRMFSIIAFREQVSRDSIIQQMYNDPDEEPDNVMNVLSVNMTRIRRKLAGLDLKVETVWGLGYYMTKEDRAKAIELARKAMEQ